MSFLRFETRNAQPLNGFLGPLEGTPWGFILLVGILMGIAFLLARLLREAGFSRWDAGLLALAPLTVPIEADLLEVGTQTTIAINAAGFFIPLALAVKFLVQGKAHRGMIVVGTALVSAVAYLSSYAVPTEGVLLYYRVPAFAAAGLAVLCTWGRWREAGPLAYASGSLGVIIGADLFHIHELMGGGHGVHRIILGGAGVLDGIFLVGILSGFLIALTVSVQQTWRSLTRSEAPDRLPAPASPGEPPAA